MSMRLGTFCVLSIMALLMPLPAHAAEESPARQFAASALTLRSASVAAEERALEVLAAMPGAGMVARETLPVLWSPFFANAIVKLGRLPSSAPVALYYNPLLDIAVLTFWTRAQAGYRVQSIRALPGERLAAPDAEAPVEPAWMSAQGGAVGALADATTERLGVFRRDHPAEASEPGRDTVTFAVAAADLRAALPRLAWHVAQRAQWTDEARPWLRPTLVGIEQALAARDPAALVSAAPDTDADTASALAALPAGFAADLELDMALEAGETNRLLIASLTGDGDTYLFTVCSLNADACVLRRFMLVSLLD